MPVTPTFPGVYVEEIPSGVRTIVGVATSITAFLGRASRGPISEPTTIFSFADFERQFGGLGLDHPMSYAVRDFYVNGGNQAIIVRVVHTDVSAPAVVAAAAVAAGVAGATAATVASAARTAANTFKTGPEKTTADGVATAAETAAAAAGAKPADVNAAAAKAAADSASTLATAAEFDLAALKAKGAMLPIVAASPGVWGSNLQVGIDYYTKEAPTLDQKTGQPDPAKVTVFNLTVNELDDAGNIVQQEVFLNVSNDDSNPQYLPRVLRDGSNLVRVKKNGPGPNDWPAFDFPPGTVGKNPVPDPVTGRLKLVPVSPSIQGLDGPDLDGSDLPGDPANKTGVYALEKADLFNLLCVPPDTRDGDLQDLDETIYGDLAQYCQKRRAMLIIDSPHAWSQNKETAARAAFQALANGDLKLSGDIMRNAVLYFPRVKQPDPLLNNQLDTFVPCGIIAGVMATTDVQRGVWKAPAGIDAGLNGIVGLDVNLTNDENGLLNPVGINCLRTFPIIGSVVWGTRTLRGADILADDYKYLPVRRTALFIEESLYRGTQWVVFEPNDEPLWAQIRLNVGAFMHDLFVQGAFQGQTPADAYFVKCDKTTTTQNDINKGIVNIIVGFAPLKPAEFVIIQIQQIAGNILT
jgi:phage tail sheath protein FI